MTRFRGTFRSLSVRNYRLYFTGQSVSLIGTWMQRLGQEWLVLQLTGSGTWLGVIAALQFLPILLLAPWGGLIADRVDKRRLILTTQIIASLLAFVLAVLTGTGVVQLWMVALLALGLGVVTALDNPARQSFVVEMVGDADVSNAVTLNSIVVNAARAIGPAVAGTLIALVGIASSFFVNGASYIFVVGALLLMDTGALRPSVPAARGPGQLREGFRYVRRTPELRSALLLMAVAGMLAYEFTVTLPLLARFVFHGGAATLGLLNTAIGVGAVLGGLLTASRAQATERALVGSALAFGGMLVITAFMPTLPLAVVSLAVLGAVSIQFLSMGNALLQLRTDPRYRGRVMALWAVAFFGTTPIGAPIVGWVGEVGGARAGLLLGGVATVLAAGFVAMRQRRARAGAVVDASPPAETVELVPAVGSGA